MKQQYRKAMRYAYVLDKENYQDLVHNAYVYFHKKSNGKNLFEQPEGYMLKCIKFMWRWNLSNTVINKAFIDIADVFIAFDGKYQSLFASGEHSQFNPHAQLEGKEAVDLIYKKIGVYKSGGLTSIKAKMLVDVMEKLSQGYSAREIGRQMKLSEKLVSYYRKKIKGLIGEMRNV